MVVIGAPDTLQGQRRPPGSAAIGYRACPTVLSGGQEVGSTVAAVQVLVVAVFRRCGLPVEDPPCVALDRHAVHGVHQVFVGEHKIAAIERVVPGKCEAVNIDSTTENGLPAGVAQISGGTPLRCILPKPIGVAGTHAGVDVVGQLELGMVLNGGVLGARTQVVPRGIGIVGVQYGAGNCGTRSASKPGAFQAGGKCQRLAMAVGTVQVDKPGPIARSTTQRSTGLPGVVGVLGSIQTKGLAHHASLHMGF